MFIDESLHKMNGIVHDVNPIYTNSYSAFCITFSRPTALENINIKDTILTSNHEASCDKVDSNIIILNPNKDDILCGQTMKGKEFYPGNIALLGKQGTTPDLTESNNEEIIPSKLLTR